MIFLCLQRNRRRESKSTLLPGPGNDLLRGFHIPLRPCQVHRSPQHRLLHRHPGTDTTQVKIRVLYSDKFIFLVLSTLWKISETASAPSLSRHE